jgi:rubrerythrin
MVWWVIETLEVCKIKRNKKEEEKGLPTSEKKQDNSRTKAWVYIYIACLTIIMITKVMPIMADLRFAEDGYQSHYYVERWNQSAYGIIDLTYYTPTHTLEVKTANIKVLGIDSRSLYEDKCERVSGRNPYDDSNLYKKYFIERDLFNVNIVTLDNRPIENLSFKDTPIAYEVRVNGETWIEGVGYYYTPDYGMVIGNVPLGTTNVEIWFKSPGNTGPTAIVENDEIIAEVNEIITFDASFSHDDVGIEYYYWDFGEGNFSVETTPITTFSYSKEGKYCVILTVRDSDSLIDRAYINVTVNPISGNHAPTIIGVVPNQSGFGNDLEDLNSELKWYLTGENKSLYTIAGENMSSILIFIPMPKTFGNDEVILWLEDASGAKDSQILWINITQVNDPPYFYPQPPNLFIHYDDPGIDDDPNPWDFTFYVHDTDTPVDELSIITSEPTLDSGRGYVEVDGLKVTFHYPHSMLNESILVTLTLSDGTSSAQTVILVTVTSDWVPELIGELPDIVLEENSTLYDAFDLDDYFIDRDHDSLFFSSGYFNIRVDIKENNSVDITAIGQWIGSELVTFRAEDPIGAIVEDTITVTVIPRNDGPVISGVPDLVVHFDYPYSFDLSPYIYDLDNNTAELMVWTSEAISNIWIQHYNNLGIVVKYPESMNGITIPVTIYVSDGIEIASQRIQISVTDDFPPELIYKLPDIVFEEDTVLKNAFVLSNYFLDIDGDALYYTNGTKFINAIINENLIVDFSAPENWYGSEIVTFRATDPHGALVEDKILVIVVPVNDPPIISGIPDQDMREGEQWILDLSQYIDDVDNHPSELIITGESQVGQDFVTLIGTILIFQYPEDIQYDMVMVTVSDGQLESSADIRIGNPSPLPGQPTLWDLIPWPWVFLSLLVATGGAFAFHKKRSRYWVYEAFLIHEDGLPIAHASPEEIQQLEDVVVSGMFTAVQNFVNDVFSGKTEEDWEVDEMTFGDNKILIERSPNLYLAVIFEGNGHKLRNRVKKLLQNINEEYGAILEDWDGDMSKLKDLSAITGSLIPKKAPKRPETKHLGAQSEISSEELEKGSMGRGGTNEEAWQSDEELLEKVKEPSPETVEVEEMETVELYQCPVCGKELDIKDTKCPRCGAKFAEI